MLTKLNEYESNIQTERSNTELLNQGSSFVPNISSDRISYAWVVSSTELNNFQEEESGKTKLQKLHRKMIQEIQEEGEIQDDPIDEISSILGRMKIGHRALKKVVFESHT